MRLLLDRAEVRYFYINGRDRKQFVCSDFFNNRTFRLEGERIEIEMEEAIYPSTYFWGGYLSLEIYLARSGR